MSEKEEDTGQATETTIEENEDAEDSVGKNIEQNDSEKQETVEKTEAEKKDDQPDTDEEIKPVVEHEESAGEEGQEKNKEVDKEPDKEQDANEAVLSNQEEAVIPEKEGTVEEHTEDESQDINQEDDHIKKEESDPGKDADKNEEEVLASKEDVMTEGGDAEVDQKQGNEDPENVIEPSASFPQPSAGVDGADTEEQPPTPEVAVSREDGEKEKVETHSQEKSVVENASARDILQTFREEEQTQPLRFDWTFGFNRHIGCLNLSDNTRNLVFYVSSHVGVIYDFENNFQKLLLGHANSITSIACSGDKRWLVTADKGENSSVIVWDSYTGIPVQTVFNVGNEKGTIAIAMSADAKHIITVGAGDDQMISVWDWTTSISIPICSVNLGKTHGVQTSVQFHPYDNEQFVTNSETQVLFYSWSSGKLELHAPFLSDEVFNRAVGLYTQSVFQTNSRQALTGTSQGNLVVWDPERPSKNGGKEISFHKRALKLVRMQDRAITTLTQTDDYIVTGDVTGNVKFYDSSLNLINWYKESDKGPVASISFKHDPEFDVEVLAETKNYPKDATIPSNAFIVKDFSVSTKNAEIFNVLADGTQFTKILDEHDAAVHALASCPTKPWISIGSYSGLLKIWNYETKQCVVTRIFNKGNNIRCLTFDKSGLQMAVGMMNGSVFILDTISLEDELEKPFRYARDAVTHIAFSHNSKYLATCDADLATTVFVYDAEIGWRYLGRYRAHYKPITDVIFGVALDSDQSRLLTLGEDRTLVEYDLQNSSKDDLRLYSIDRIEQSATPNCLTWYPNITKESFLLMANDQYKFKLYNTTTKMCRRTLLAPTYGSPIQKMLVLPANNTDEHSSKARLLAYTTQYKIGLQLLPLDGNPHKSIAFIGHSNGISHLTCSKDGKYLFTAGGKDSCVHMWSVSVKSLEAAAALGGEGLTPFYGLLEGGVNGELFAELENYFYYAQLRSQGIDTTESREVSTVIPLEQIPFVMRALGFYPSEQEIEDMLNEVKFSEYVETGQYVNEINLADFIRLYVNHRPAFGLSPDDIEKAFGILGSTGASREKTIGKRALFNILQRRGEHMTEDEVAEYLATLVGINQEGGSTELKQYSMEDINSILDEILPDQITSTVFSEEILGLPVYEE